MQGAGFGVRGSGFLSYSVGPGLQVYQHRKVLAMDEMVTDVLLFASEIKVSLFLLRYYSRA